MKITDLSAATVPLAGTELFEVVQSGSSLKVAASDIAASYGSVWPVASGGSGAATLTGYVKGNGTSAMTASATVPFSDISARPYAQLLSLVDQTSPANAATLVFYDAVPAPASGITLVTNGSTLSRITIPSSGVYRFDINALFVNVGAAAVTASLWLRKNGADIAGSNTNISIPAKAGSVNGAVVANIPFMDTGAASDYYEVAWSTPSTDVTMDTIAAQATPTRPATPSIIVNVVKVA